MIALPSFVGSIIQFTKPNNLERELNERFRQAHPAIDPTITLSKIRKVKHEMVEHLKKLIKKPEFDSFAANRLKLWQVDIAEDDHVREIEIYIYLPRKPAKNCDKPE